MSNVIGPIDFASWRTMSDLNSFIRDHQHNKLYNKTVERDRRLLREIKKEVLGK